MSQTRPNPASRWAAERSGCWPSCRVGFPGSSCRRTCGPSDLTFAVPSSASSKSLPLLRRVGRRFFNGITFPHVFQRLGQRLLLHTAVAVPRVAGEDELVVVALGGQGLGHVLVGKHP